MKPERYAHVLSFALSHPWNLDQDMLPVIAGILARHIAGADSSAEIAAALVNRKNLPQARAGSVAIIPVYGVIGPRMNLFSEMSGGTTFEKLTKQLHQAMANADVRTIVLDVDSPGGTVAGGAEFTAEVMKARTKKPIVAVAQFLMASAAYQLGSAATEIVAAPTARIGSVGTYMIHTDLSKALAELGIARTYISAGEGKVDGNETQPPSEAYLARAQASIDDAYGQFVDLVVQGRGKGTTAEQVRTKWKAHCYSAAEALQLGMIDRIATLDDTLTRLLSESPDAEDRRLALTLASSAEATTQEPATATVQEPTSDASWQNATTRALLELDL
jgi:signal peptide peptidase SppA